MTIIAVTGYGQAEDRRSSEESGIDLHLVKPLDFHALRQLLIDPQSLCGDKTNN